MSKSNIIYKNLNKRVKKYLLNKDAKAKIIPNKPIGYNVISGAVNVKLNVFNMYNRSDIKLL